jgi:hypothetical protein
MTKSIFDLHKPQERIDDPRWTFGWLDTQDDVFYVEPMEGLTTEEAMIKLAEFMKNNHTSYDTAFYLTPTKK